MIHCAFFCDKVSAYTNLHMPKFKAGQKVEWKWPPGYVTGVVQESFTETVRRTIKGKIITRHGSGENPAYLLLTKKGVHVLKLESELADGHSGPLSSRTRKP